MSITIELCSETVNNIIVKELYNTLQSMKCELGAGNHIFVYGDQEQDDQLIQKHINAIELTLKWYASPDQMQGIGLSYDS